LNNLKVSRILHAGYLFEADDFRILFDPIFKNPFSVNCFAFPPVSFDTERIKRERFSAIFISHYHDDHCCFESLDLLDRQTPVYLYCVHDELFALVRELGFREVYSLKLNQTIEIGPMKITPLLALDPDIDTLFSIRCGDLKVLNVVDSWIDPSTLSILSKDAPWDLVLWPFQTMRELEVLSPFRAADPDPHLPPEWLDQIKRLNPRAIVASACQFQHEPWSWYNHFLFPVTYWQFFEEVKTILPDTLVFRLDPAQSLALDRAEIKSVAPLEWILTSPVEIEDFEFNPRIEIPSTEQIASHFPKLSAPHKERVLRYCSGEILENYRALDFSESSYFNEPRFWRLSLIEPNEDPSHFYYLIEGNKISPLDKAPITLNWFTEIIATKLYNALECGESLSSLYVRVNGHSFDLKTEQEINEVCPSEDPLVRCLYEGKFAQYQLFQLKQLKTRTHFSYLQGG